MPEYVVDVFLRTDVTERFEADSEEEAREKARDFALTEYSSAEIAGMNVDQVD